MDRKTKTQLMRLLHDELPESEARLLRQRLREESELLQVFEALKAQWQALELPEPQPAPLGLSTSVLAMARETEQGGVAPAWWSHTLAGKATTAVLLAGGIAFGAILASPSEAEDWSDYLVSEPSMVDSYWIAVEEPEDDGSWQEHDS